MVALLAKQQGQMDKSFSMIWREIERLAIALRGFGCRTIRILDEAQQVEDFRGRTELLEMRQGDLLCLLYPSCIGDPFNRDDDQR